MERRQRNRGKNRYMNKRIMKTQIMRHILLAALLLCGVLGSRRTAYAQEGANAISGELKQTESAMPAMEAPDVNAPIVMEFPAGSPVFVTSEDEDWYEIFYQGRKLYLLKEPPVEDTSVNEAAIAKEMERQMAEDTARIEQYEAENTARKSTWLWRGIAAGVIAIIAIVAGIIGVRRKRRT